MPDPDVTAACRAIHGSSEMVTVPAEIAARVLDRSVKHTGPVEYTCRRDGSIMCGNEVVWETGGDEVIEYCERQREMLNDA